MLHWDVMGSKFVDHINGNGLDNRDENLRLATNSQNQMNSRKRSGTSSRYKGVSLQRKRWRAQIKLDGKLIYLGMFDTEEQAAMAYDYAAIELFGEFSRINFPHESWG
jgi:hypothetical protein